MSRLANVIPSPPMNPPKVGLLASVTPVTPADEHWANGISWEPDGSCLGAGTAEVCSDEPSDKIIATSDGSYTYDPFVIWGGDKCSSFGFNARDYQGRARRQLARLESTVLEAELWDGTEARVAGLGNNKWLAHPDSDVLTAGVGVTPIDALACLEQGLAVCGGGSRGMIHATRQVVTHWNNLGMLRREGTLLLTVNDTIVVPGAGYTGSGPSPSVDDDPVAAADGAIWAYATDVVQVYLGNSTVVPPTVAEAIDRVNNLIEYRAERPAAVFWNYCCHFAVQIDLDVCDVGGAGS